KKSLILFDHFFTHGPGYIKDEFIRTTASESFVCFRPMGVIFGIMPWNFPLWQIVRFAIPTLVLGNTVVIKHSENTFGSALLIEKIFHEAGLKDVYQNIMVSHDDAARLVKHPLIRGVSLTGSVRAGQAVGELAGRALKKCVLELGGSDAYL